MNVNVGDRVGAVQYINKAKKEIGLFGYGTYEGEYPIPKEFSKIGPVGLPNPKIKLDSGEEVWGFECYWGEEEAVRKTVSKAETVVQVNPTEERNKAIELAKQHEQASFPAPDEPSHGNLQEYTERFCTVAKALKC